LTAAGIQTSQEGAGLSISKTKPEELLDRIQSLVENTDPNAVTLAMQVPNKVEEKYDDYLSPELLGLDYAARALDIGGALEALGAICEQVA
jgi:hypothetical protein